MFLDNDGNLIGTRRPVILAGPFALGIYIFKVPTHYIIYKFFSSLEQGYRRKKFIHMNKFRAQSRTSNHKAWFRYPASLVRRFWEM